MDVVFHHSNDDPARHTRVCNNIENLLDDETVATERVVLVANSGGLGLLRADSPCRSQIASLADRGVRFAQCRNTLVGTDTDAADLLDDVEVVPSGVGELARLQAAGYAYLRP